LSDIGKLASMPIKDKYMILAIQNRSLIVNSLRMQHQKVLKVHCGTCWQEKMPVPVMPPKLRL